jgi:TctA family transporter
MSRYVWRAVAVLVTLIILGLAWTGISGGVNQLPESSSLGQKIQSVTQLAYGILSLVALAAWFLARRWSRVAFTTWEICLAMAAGLAAVVWGDETIVVGVLTGVASFVIGWGIAWVLRFSASRGDL